MAEFDESILDIEACQRDNIRVSRRIYRGKMTLTEGLFHKRSVTSWMDLIDPSIRAFGGEPMESNCGDLAQSPETDWTLEKTIKTDRTEILIDPLGNGAEMNPDLWERGQT